MTIQLPLSTAILIVMISSVSGQSDQQVERYFKQFPEADMDGDGELTREEAKAHRQAARQRRARPAGERTDPSEGDNLASQSHIPAVKIPESVSPVKGVVLKSDDDVDLSFAYRVPKGKGPFPAILFFHGGGRYSNIQKLRNNLLNQPIHTRFLNEGFVTIASTRRPYWKTNDGSPSGFYDAVEDAALIVEKAKTLPGVDPDKIILYGGSGGGILAIVTASKVELGSVIAGEPATVVPIDPRIGQMASPADYRDLMEDPYGKYTGARKKEMVSWMKNIDCPVLVLQGRHTGLYKTNFEILIPEMKRLGKDISSIHYPGVTHGFYWGSTKTGATIDTVEKIMKDVTAYIGKRL